MASKNLTLYIPADLANNMEKLPEVNWSEVARRAIIRYINERLSASIPMAVIERLKDEKGKEFANGKKYAIESVLSKVSYKELDRFFRTVNDLAEKARENEAAMVGVDPHFLSLRHHYERIAFSQMQHHFQVDANITDEFRRGVLAALEEARRAIMKP